MLLTFIINDVTFWMHYELDQWDSNRYTATWHI